MTEQDSKDPVHGDFTFSPFPILTSFFVFPLHLPLSPNPRTGSPLSSLPILESSIDDEHHPSQPSEVSPNSAKLIAELFAKYLDPESYTIVNGGVPQATALLDQRFEHIFYTGNGQVGRIVAEKAAKWLCPVSLELGGKSPVIVDDSADLKIAAHR